MCHAAVWPAQRGGGGQPISRLENTRRTRMFAEYIHGERRWTPADARSRSERRSVYLGRPDRKPGSVSLNRRFPGGRTVP